MYFECIKWNPFEAVNIPEEHDQNSISVSSWDFQVDAPNRNAGNDLFEFIAPRVHVL